MNKNKVILFGVDGATWTLLDNYAADGSIPNLDYCVKRGVKASLFSTFPPLTLPAWTSIFTGVNPGKHGMTDFRMRFNDKFVLANSQYRMVDSLWQIVSRYGLRSIVINDPVTYPPEKINGIMTTGLLTPYYSNYVQPFELKDEIEKIAGGYMFDLPVNFYELVSTDKSQAYKIVEDFAIKIARVTMHLAKNYEWDILAPIFTSTDKLQHFYWDEPDYLKRHYKLIDTIFRDILDLANENNATLFIVSDHGFGPAGKSLNINTWLAKEGFQNVKKNLFFALLSKLGLRRENIVPTLNKLHIYKLLYTLARKHFNNLKDAAFFFDKRVDFDSSLAYSESEFNIYMNKKIDRMLYEQTRSDLLARLVQIKDGDNKVVETAHRREEVLWGPYVERAPDIFFLTRGYTVSHHSSSSVFGLASDYRGRGIITGTHRPNGVFAAYGCDIKAGHRIEDFVQTWDIAPTILHRLGLPIPSYMDGRALIEIYNETSESYARNVQRQSLSERERIRKRLRKIERL